jgi:pimeloyl-[acyl-carrier protein] methyl ester esterase
VDIVQARQLRPAIINGWSLGGAVAVETAHRLGRGAAGLILTCAASPRYVQADDFPYGGVREDVLGMQDAILADRAGFFKGLSAGVCAKDVGQPAIDWMWSIFMDAGPQAIKAMLALADLDQRAILAGLDIPVLSIIGTQDGVVPPQIGEQAAACAQRGSVVRFEGCGHAPFLEDGPTYIKTLLDFAHQI